MSLVFVSCSDKPVNMDTQLYELAGKYLTKADFSTIPFYNKRVYYGPAYSLHKNGEKKEKGDIINGAKSGIWSGWDDKGNLKFKGSYFEGNEDGPWKGYHANGKIKYEGEYKNGKQIETWKYYNKRGKMITEEVYYTCDEDCTKQPIPDWCRNEGKVKKSKNFK